jgi:hypothetical protein
MKLMKHWMLCAALAACAAGASAQNGPRPDGQRPDGPPPGPPPEAIAACKGKVEGAKAEFKAAAAKPSKAPARNCARPSPSCRMAHRRHRHRRRRIANKKADHQGPLFHSAAASYTTMVWCSSPTRARILPMV